ncbi:ABC transporter transmembrane domain-containing protein [Synechococcus sp. AH-229-G18]|nr:ABC transporter transmembrane domain-containing protein [Synechococcus sp. AH-229-G18]
MTSLTPQDLKTLRTHAPFDQLSPSSNELIETTIAVNRCDIGHQLIHRQTLPNKVYIILEGEIRLLGLHHGQPFTIGRMGAGAIVGLASLLRAKPCEQVSAASNLVIASLPDATVLELYKSDEGFRKWCQSSFWLAETCAIIDIISKGVATPLSSQELRERAEGVHKEIRLLKPSESITKQIAIDDQVLVASANIEACEIGNALSDTESPPISRPPLAPRLVALRSDLIKELQATKVEVVSSPSEVKRETINSAAERTGMDFGQERAENTLQIIRAKGVTPETLAIFAMISKLMNLPYRKDAIDKILRDKLKRGMKPDLQLIGQIGAMLGLLVSAAKIPSKAITRMVTPCIIPWNGNFAIVIRSHADGVVLASPAEGWLKLSSEEIENKFPEGLEVLLMERTSSSPEENFGMAWFWPVIRRYRGILLQVLAASFFVQLFTLANPLLIQVIIDKVINQRSLDTLQILGFALVVVTIAEGVLGSLRTFLLTDTTNRIDMRLGAEVIDKLLRLPLGYFDKRPVGELGTRIAELEKIRNFLTGQGLSTVLDAIFSVIYIGVMLLYSWLLTIIALIVLPIQIALTLAGSPIIRRQIRDAATDNAKTQSHLVEVLTGIQTVKAQNVEMVSRWKWQNSYSRYISRTFERTVTGTALSQTSQVLQKLSQLFVLWIGATLVLDGKLTLGQLIAFRIISGYVTQPLLRLSSIWQNIQELRVSFERLADIVDTPEESDEIDRSKIPLPPIDGKVTFEDLNFRFSPSSPDVLKNINLEVIPGTFVGIVGQSGSGKSTLMKLLPRLYSPNQGRVTIDGYDIDKVELYSLRRQVGIVPQEPLLFSGTVSENIALANPDADNDEIVHAAKLAEAHDFIMGLSAGYSSTVGERGASLSGGQRQRIAIARTLLTRPQLLVMDEATSALDYDTERRVCENLLDGLKSHTVFFITHRLTSIRRADLIVMMHEGAIAEVGTHDQLMAAKGRYFALYRQQEAG